MGYRVRFQMKPKKGMFRKQYGVLRMESKRKFSTRSDALKEARKMIKIHKYKRYTFKTKIIKA